MTYPDIPPSHPDPEKLRALAQKWDEQAGRLDSYGGLVRSSVDGILWEGQARNAMRLAADKVIEQVGKAAQGAREWANALREVAGKWEEFLRKQKVDAILQALLGVFGVILLVVSFVLGPILAAVADILIGMTSLTGLARTIATLVLDIALGVLTYGGLQVGFDMAAGGIAHASVPGSGSFKPTAWEALSAGLAGFMGGLGSIRGLPGLGRGMPKGGVSNVVDVPVTPSTSRGVGNVGEIGDTVRPGGSPPLSATPHVDAAAGGPRSGAQRAAGPPEGIAGNGPLSSARITPDAGRSFDASGGALGARGNAAFERVPGASADGGVPGVPRALTGDGPATVVRRPPMGDQPGAVGPPRAFLDGPSTVGPGGPRVAVDGPSALGPGAPRAGVDGPPAVGPGGPRAAVDGPPTVGSGPARVGVDGPAAASPGSFRAGAPEAPSSARISPVAERLLDTTGGASGARGGTVPERTAGIPQAVTGDVPTSAVRNPARPPLGDQVATPAGPRAVLDGPATAGPGSARVGPPDAATSAPGTQPTGGPARDAAAARPGSGRVGDPPRTVVGEASTPVVSSGGRTVGRADEVVDSPPRDAAVAGPSVDVSPHTVGAPPTLPKAAVGHGEPPTAITVSAADAIKVPRADPSLPGKLPAVSGPVPKPSVTIAPRPVGSESMAVAGVATREAPTPSTAGGAARVADGAPATSGTRAGTPGVTPRSPEAGRPSGADPVRSAPIDRSEIRSTVGGSHPGRTELDTVARNLSERHAELVSAKAVRAERIPDPKEAAAAQRAMTMAEARAQFWSSIREGMAAQFGPHAGRLAGQNRQTLERFAAFFASEAGVAKELPAIRTMIGRDFSATIQGEMAGAVKTVAADIVRRAGLPASRFDPVVSRLGATNRAEFAQAMDDFRNAIRDHRTEQARGGRYEAATDRPTTLDQARTMFDADTKAIAARDARAAVGERSDPRTTRAADDAAQVRREVETEARNWAAARDKEFSTLSKSLGKQFADERYATAYVQREQRVEYRPGQNPARSLDDAVAHINRRWEAAVSSASAVQRFRPDADAAFNAEVLATRNIAGLTKVAGAPRLRSLESLPEEEAATWRASFRDAVDNEFERVWRPVYEAGHGPGSARFQATEEVWAARFQGMREQLRVDGFAYHEIQRVTDDIAEARADLAFRGGSAGDVTRALQVIREKYHAEIGDLVRGLGRRGPDLSKWDDLAARMQTEVRRAFAPEATAGRRPVESERVGGDPFTDRRPAPDGSPTSALHPDLAGVRDRAIQDFASLDPLSQAKLPKSMLDRLEATYVHERLTAYDAIMHTGDTRVPAQILHDLRIEAQSTAGGPTPSRTRSAPESWAEHRRQIGELLHGRGLAVTPTSGGLVVHADAAQAVADSALVGATRRLGELPGGLRIVAGPGVRPEVDLAGLGPLARDGVVLYAPFLDDGALVEVARSTGLTVAFRSRPAPGDAVAHPVDSTGVATLHHLAVEWRSGAPAVDAPFGLTPGARPGLYRLGEGWTLESHSWGVWARPPEVAVSDALSVRLGELSGDTRVVVGASGVDVPDAVLREIHHLAERLPMGDRPGITWLSRPGGRDTTPHLVDGPADPATSARTQKYGDAFDLAETRRLVGEKADRDLRSVEPNVEQPSPAAADLLLRAYEADADALVTRYLGGREGWHGHADVVGFAREYDELRSALPGRFDAQVRWEARASEVRSSVEEAFHQNAGPRDRAELFPETGPEQTGEHIAAFWERFSPRAAKEIDDLAKSGPHTDLAAAVDARIATLTQDVRRHVETYLTGESALLEGLARSRAIGDEVRPGGNAMTGDLVAKLSSKTRKALDDVSGAGGPIGGNALADEIAATLSGQTRHAFDKVFGPEGAFGVERWRPESTFAGSAEARQLDDVFAPEHLASVEKRVRGAFESLRRADPDIERSVGFPARLTAAHYASTRLEQAAATRTEVREAAGLRPDLTPEQLTRFHDDLIARVDDGLHSSRPRDDADVDGAGDVPRGAASPAEARARFDELTGDRLATELDVLAEPHLVRFSRDTLMLRLHDVAGPLDSASLDRLGTRLAADVRRAYDEIHAPGRPSDEASEAWARKVDEIRDGLPGRVEAELDSLGNLKSAAQEFHTIERSAAYRSGAPLRSDVVADLAAAHRAEFMAARDRNLRVDSERTTWLADEHRNGDQYGSHLAHLRRDSWAVDLEWRLDADLRAAVDRLDVRGGDRAEPEAAAAAIRRSFVDEMQRARYGDNFTSVWQKRYQSLSDSVDTQLTVVMMERRIKDVTEDFLSGQRGELLDTEVRRVGDVVSQEFGAALRQEIPRLPSSLGRAEQQSLLREISPAVADGVSRTLLAEGFSGVLPKLASDSVRRAADELAGPQAVPTSARAGFAGELERTAARLDEAIAEALSRPSPGLTDESRASSAAALKAGVLAELDGAHQRDWKFDRAALERRIEETVRDIDRRIDSQPLRQETERLLVESLARDVPAALAAMNRNSVSTAALAAAGEAFTNAVTAEFRSLAAVPSFTLTQVNRWNTQYGRLIGSVETWVTSYLIGQRIEQLVQRHLHPAPGTTTDVDADRVAQVRQRLEQVVTDNLAPYLATAGQTVLPPSLGVDEQVRLAGEIGKRLDEVAKAESVPSLGEEIVTSLRQDPVAARTGAGLSAERAALSRQAGERLQGVLSAYEPGPLVTQARAAFLDRVGKRFDQLAEASMTFDRQVLAGRVEEYLAGAEEFVATYVRWTADRTELPTVVQRRIAEARRDLPPPSMDAVEQFTTAVVQEFDRAHPVHNGYGEAVAEAWQTRLDGMFYRLESWLVTHAVGARAVERTQDAEQAAAVREALRPYLDLSKASSLPSSMGPREQEVLGRALLVDAAPQERDAFAEDLRGTPVPTRPGNDFATRRARVEESLTTALAKAKTDIKYQVLSGSDATSRFRDTGLSRTEFGHAVRRHLDGTVEDYRTEVLAALDTRFEQDWKAGPSLDTIQQIAAATTAVTSRMVRAYAVDELRRELAVDVVGPAAAEFRAAVLRQVTARVAAGKEFGAPQYEEWQREYRQLIKRSQAWQTIRVLADRAHQFAPGRGAQNKSSRRFAAAIDKVVKPYLDLSSSRHGVEPARSLGRDEQRRLVDELARVIPARAAGKLRGLVQRDSVASDPAWKNSYYPTDFAHERVRLENRLRSEAPGTDEAPTAFRDDQLQRFDAANERDWNFDRAAWSAELEQRLAAKDDWIASWERRTEARAAFGNALDKALETALEKLPGVATTLAVGLAGSASLTPALQAAERFREVAMDEFDSTYPPESRFSDEQAGQWQRRLNELTRQLDGWLTVWRVGDRIVRGLLDTAVARHGVDEAYHGPVSQTIDRLARQVGRALDPHLSLTSRRHLPAGLSAEEQADFAAYLVRRVSADDVAGVGLDGDVGAAARQWLRTDPVTVPPAAADHASQRTQLQEQVDRLPGEPAAVAAFRAEVLREFDQKHARWWELDVTTWPDRLAARLAEAPAALDSYSRRQRAREDIATVLRPHLETATARSGLPADEVATATAEFVDAVTKDFDRRFPSRAVFGSEQQEWWADHVGGMLPRLDSWLAVRTIAARARELAPAADTKTAGEVLGRYLDVVTIKDLPALFGPAERDALVERIVPLLVRGADDALVDSFRDRIPARDGVGFAAERAALDERLSELLRNHRTGSEVDEAAMAAPAAFRAEVLSDLDSRFARDWNYDRARWRQEYDRTAAESTRWLDEWTAGDRMRSADRAVLVGALDKSNADPQARELVLRAFDRLYRSHSGSALSVGLARQRWESEQSRILDGLDEYRRRSELTSRLTGDVDAVVADQHARWREAQVADWELDQLLELGQRLVSGLTAARLSGALPGQHSTRPAADLTEQLDRAVSAWAAAGQISPQVRTLAASLRAALINEVRDALPEPVLAPEPTRKTPTPAVARLTPPDLADGFRRRVVGVIAGPLRESHAQMERDFVREAEPIFDRPGGSASEATARGDYSDLIERFRKREPFYERIVAFRRTTGDVAALRARWESADPQLVERMVAGFEQAVGRIAGEAWDAAQYEMSRVAAAADKFERQHAELVDAVTKQMTEIREAEELRARGDELITTQLRDFETEHGNLDPQARMIARYAAQTLVVPAHRDLGADAVQALRAQFRLAGAYSRFVANLPAGTPDVVRRNGLDAFGRLLGAPADAADQLERVLASLADRVRRQAVFEEPVTASTSEPDRLREERGPVRTDEEASPVPTGDERSATRSRRAEVRREERRRARADELIEMYLRVSEVKHGDLDPQARELAYDAARSHVVATGPEHHADSMQALRRLFRLAHEYTRFVADLPDGTPEAVRREGLDAYTRLLGEPTQSADQLPGVLAVLVDQARQPIIAELLAARAADPDRLSRALGTVPAGDERTALEGFLGARVLQASADLAAGVRIAAIGARFAPDRVDAALDQFDADLDRAARDWADNAALRTLARTPEGRDFLREPGMHRLDAILSSLARDASPEALASLPSLLAALPSMGADTAVVRNLLINVGQFLKGDADAYEEAFKRAAFVRVRSRGALMEFVMALHVLNPRLVELGNRIMDC
ncbi:hypothetical protein [Micromonospora sp. NPDC005979]|uniref:hypothetical protein n=1 Tax=Micromonospora sp. NPDC005979 TaxID=3156726 RepID=UPI0033A328C8